MKKLVIITVVAVLALAGMSYARGGHGHRSGCDSGCNNIQVSPEKAEKFAEESLPLRKEALEKRYELEREYLKKTPDQAKVDKLEKEFSVIKGKVLELRTKYGINGKTSAPCASAPCVKAGVTPCGGIPCGAAPCSNRVHCDCDAD